MRFLPRKLIFFTPLRREWRHATSTNPSNGRTALVIITPVGGVTIITRGRR